MSCEIDPNFHIVIWAFFVKSVNLLASYKSSACRELLFPAGFCKNWDFRSKRILEYSCNPDSNFSICSLPYNVFFFLLFSSPSSWPGFVDSVSLYKQSISERKQIIRTEKDSCRCFVTDRMKCFSDKACKMISPQSTLWVSSNHNSSDIPD